MAKKPAQKDWHRADIIAAVRKSGTSLQAMSLALGYSRSTLRNALNHPAPKYERIIAMRLGITPQLIWPSRYHLDGSSKSGRGERGIGRYVSKNSKNVHVNTPKKSRNVYDIDRRAA